MKNCCCSDNEGAQRCVYTDNSGRKSEDNAVSKRSVDTYSCNAGNNRQDNEISQGSACSRVRKVMVIYTGGTIGMRPDENGALVPASNALEQRLKSYPEFHDPDEYKNLVQNRSIEPNEQIMVVKNIRDDVSLVYQMYEYPVLLDSSDMNSGDWLKIASDIDRYYDYFDGFVILHGTDTLSYTACILSFMLENLKKPVILTGAQKSIFEPHSDATNNIMNSLIFASMEFIQEVCVCFSNRLMRGNRCVKESATDLEAFDSPNYPNLAKLKVHITVYKDFLLDVHRPNCYIFKVHKRLEKNVNILKFQPLLTLNMIVRFLRPPARGLVLETYGTGNVPNMSGLAEALETAVQVHGIIIVNVTQCCKGSVGAIYPMAQTLEKIGVIAGNDMTAEAALCKLSYVLGRLDWSLERKIQAMKVNICGEISFPGDYFSVYK